MKKINNTFNYEVFKWRSEQDYISYVKYKFIFSAKSMIKNIFSQPHKKMWFDDDIFSNLIKMLNSDDLDTNDLLTGILINSPYKFSPKQNSIIFSKEEYIWKLYYILTPTKTI